MKNVRDPKSGMKNLDKSQLTNLVLREVEEAIQIISST